MRLTTSAQHAGTHNDGCRMLKSVLSNPQMVLVVVGRASFLVAV